MAYSIGGVIEQTDYMGFRGSIGPSSAYASALTATGKVAALIGVGYSDRGYGQVSTTLPAVSVGDTISSTQWNALYSVLTTINTHTGSALTLPASVSSASTIEAQTGTGGRPNLTTIISTLDTNRLLIAGGQSTVSSGVLTNTRSTIWDTLVYHEFTATFASENDARYFFNSGGQVQAQASRTAGSATSMNTAVTNLLTAMGTVRFGATNTTQSGTGGTATAIGYYDLTTAYQDVFYQNSTDVGYTTVKYTLSAKVDSAPGVNGGNGSLLRFRAIFTTGMTPTDTVDGTLTSTINQLKATGVLTITSPTYATITSL